MQTELEKMQAFALAALGSGRWHGYCQAFVSHVYEAGTGQYLAIPSAKEAENRYKKEGTEKDLTPPAGAAVYFAGDGEMGKKYGHTAFSLGNGEIIDPVGRVERQKLSADLHNGYHGWGWLGQMPQGASEKSRSGEKKREPTTVKIKNILGKEGGRPLSRLREISADSDLWLAVQKGREIFLPTLVSEVRLSSSRKTSAAVLRFSVPEKEDSFLENGCPVAFRCRGKGMFYGYIFSIEKKSGRETAVTCFDQLRYFQNRDSFSYRLSYSDLLRFIAGRYGMKTGEIEDTGYVLPGRLEEGTILDILGNAGDRTVMATGKLYVLYDDFGQLTLKSLGRLMTNLCIEEDAAGSYSISESIDSEVYNRVVLAMDNKETGEREVFIANDTASQEKWGVLQYYEKMTPEENEETVRQRLEMLLKSYAMENRHLMIQNCIGHPAIRGGSGVAVHFKERGVKNTMICERVEHRFQGKAHWMNLELSGGGFRV